jgi:SAM-dependent MidA family methyltransferase
MIRTNQLEFPEPSEEERAHSQVLVHYIQEQIESSGGDIDFARYMELALYTPGLGYYSGPRQKFGEAGDFITAPELSPLFSACVARQCAEVLEHIDNGSIMEAGAGSGVLAAVLLKSLEQSETLPQNYFIIELSAELQQRQRQTLEKEVPHLVDRVQWLNALPDKGFRGIVVANELLDAMPVQRFRINGNEIMQLAVVRDQNHFSIKETKADKSLKDRVAQLNLPDSYTSEINFNAEAWIKSIADIIEQGLVLLFDYGYPQHEFYLPERHEGTLMCHYRHRAHDDPFAFVGLQDITSHVDFSAMAEAADTAGLSVLGYTSQAAFLMATGLDELVAKSDPEKIKQHLILTNQVKKLTLPSEMGELFKVIAFGKRINEPLTGFSLQDRRGRL